jgi:nucleoside-diphosphate-sugar epimerase
MILVTGGTGFVGRQTVSQLASNKHSLRLVVRDAASVPTKLGTTPDVIVCPDVFRAGTQWWRDTLTGVDTVVHLAWYAEPGKYLESEENLACLHGTIEIARACAAAGVRRFVGIGTCAEYDQSGGMLLPDTPLRPQTLYAACKAAAFQVLSNLLPAAGTEFAWCRLFYLHGEGEDSRRLVPYLHKQLAAGQAAELTSGNQVRDFLDVSDAGAMIARAAQSSLQGPLNICSGRPVTVRELAEGIADQYGRRDLLRFGARPDNAFDPPRVVGVPALLCDS